MHRSYTPHRACPVCRSRKAGVLARLNYALFDDLKMAGLKTVVCCESCGMRYDDLLFGEEELNEYYLKNEHYAASAIGGSGGISDDNNERYDRMIDEIGQPSGGLILDYGCGQAGFVARCISRGLRAAGIEPSAASRQRALESGLDVYGSLDEFLQKGPRSDISAVVMSHVLEHLLDPLALIRLIAHEAEGATVYIEVPDADSYLAPDALQWHELYFEHLSHFSAEHLKRLAEIAGISVIKEGKVSFSGQLDETGCRFIVGRFGASGKISDTAVESVEPPMQALKDLSPQCPLSDRKAAIWGVSQYAMLLLGSCPEFCARVMRLFDSSPAKIGRRIRGIVIEPSSEISTLGNDCELLIPRSKYLEQMLQQLNMTGFSGIVRVI